jgi:hypothetical protein
VPAGNILLGCALGLTNVYTLVADGNIDGSQIGAAALSLNHTLVANASVILSGNTAFTLPIIFAPTGSKILEGAVATNIDLNLVANAVADRYASATFNNQYTLDSTPTMDLGGAASLVNTYTLSAAVSGTVEGAVDLNMVLTLAAAGVLSSEVITKLVSFELSIKQRQDLDLAIKQLMSF